MIRLATFQIPPRNTVAPLVVAAASVSTGWAPRRSGPFSPSAHGPPGRARLPAPPPHPGGRRSARRRTPRVDDPPELPRQQREVVEVAVRADLHVDRGRREPEVLRRRDQAVALVPPEA